LDSGAASLHQITLFQMTAFLKGPSSAVFGPPRPILVRQSTVSWLVTRESWGARPAKNPPTPHQPVRMTQHHTAGAQTFTLEDSLDEVRFIQEFHQDGRGWDDIGYHYLVDAEGRIFQGRPVGVQGAHVRGNNEGNVGIALLGYYHEPFEHAVSTAQLAAVKTIGRWLGAELSIAPDTYKGHRDQGATSCPGDNVYALLDVIRDSFRTAPIAGLSRAFDKSSLLRWLREPASPQSFCQASDNSR